MDGADVLPDERLRLMFTCCHPALALDARVALTLRMVSGLSAREVAHAFLVPEATMAQRLVRAKRKIREAGLPIGLPRRQTLPGRLAEVLAVLYLVFTEGHTASAGATLGRRDLRLEAIRLARLTADLLPEHAEAAGLLALMMLTEARNPARTDAAGRPVPLLEQDRALWSSELATEGLEALERGLGLGTPGTYLVQAAIAALHTRAALPEDTDWIQIAVLYAELARLTPSPVVEVNRAVATGMAYGPTAGMAVLRPVLQSRELAGYGPMHAAHAHLLQAAGETAAARRAWRQAASSTENPVHRSALLARADDL